MQPLSLANGMIRRIRTMLARRRLQRMVDANVASFSGQDRIKRRQAMLRHTRRAGA